jgi:L-2-hydroxyglutarate oxidase LhgO
MISQEHYDFDAAVVGAGAVGLACGYALSQRGLSVILLEVSPRIGEGVSSRNSGVIHAGFYYPTGSLRAKLCVEGRRKLYPFLQAHGIDVKRCGKLIVATSDDEIPKLEKLLKQGHLNDVEGLRLIDAKEAMTMEPALACVAALHSAETGILDAHGYMLALRGEIENRGGVVVCDSPMFSAQLDSSGQHWEIVAGASAQTTIKTRYLITAPGLEAQDVARAITDFPPSLIPKRHLGKGVYFKLSGKAPFNSLVYPTPIPGALGTHYVKNLGGQAVFGPDLEYVDAIDYHVNPDRAKEFYVSVRRYWPSLPDNSLTPDYAGIRPKIHGPGEPQPDFRIDFESAHGLPGLVTMFGIESPGLTSSLAIGDYVAEQLGLAM